MRVGVIADTHGLLRPAAVACLRGSDHILHAGDIGAPGIVPALEALAPVTAIRGNIDRDAWARAFPETRTVTLGGIDVHLVHDVKDLDPDFPVGRIGVVVSGHSHRAGIDRRGGTLFLNPGSAGPRRFRLAVTVAHLTLDGDRAEARIEALDV
ncbi:metallophosphoesterase family protein [Rubellimicrobium roseum]|uniref:Phosphoesterase n=1 Tax=Rubellimicrobium roseum TaxID=687525 RepID=A0A5C4NCK4_9RHOB|nr:metallophosphoesterase family protein [Rubellimicrobium roseum]